MSDEWSGGTLTFNGVVVPLEGETFKFKLGNPTVETKGLAYGNRVIASHGTNYADAIGGFMFSTTAGSAGFNFVLDIIAKQKRGEAITAEYTPPASSDLSVLEFVNVKLANEIEVDATSANSIALEFNCDPLV